MDGIGNSSLAQTGSHHSLEQCLSSHRERSRCGCLSCICDSLLSRSVPACSQSGWLVSGTGAGQLDKTVTVMAEAGILASQTLDLGRERWLSRGCMISFCASVSLCCRGRGWHEQGPLFLLSVPVCSWRVVCPAAAGGRGQV